MEVPLPEGWVSITPKEAAAFQRELQREISTEHAVFGLPLRAIARHGNQDDYLFATGESPEGPVYVVHLTWSVESDPQWPWTMRYESLSEFLDRWPREET